MMMVLPTSFSSMSSSPDDETSISASPHEIDGDTEVRKELRISQQPVRGRPACAESSGMQLGGGPPLSNHRNPQLPPLSGRDRGLNYSVGDAALPLWSPLRWVPSTAFNAFESSLALAATPSNGFRRFS